MKNLNNYFLLLTLLSITSCQSFFGKQKGNCVGVLIDLTDSLQQLNSLNVQALKPLFTVEQNPFASTTCVLSCITDLRYTETRKFSISAEHEYASNIIERQRNIDSFYSQIDQAIRILKNESIGRQGSFVCYALAKMLETISSVECNGKKILVLSDAMESTSAFSVYAKTQMVMLKTNPEAVRQILDREYPLPDIRGIEIVFVHSPTNKAEDENFHAISQFFKWYYGTCHKATVSVTTSIPKE